MTELAGLLACFDEDWHARYRPEIDGPEGDAFRARLLVTTLSEAFAADLRDEFRVVNFPVDDSAFDELSRRDCGAGGSGGGATAAGGVTGSGGITTTNAAVSTGGRAGVGGLDGRGGQGGATSSGEATASGGTSGTGVTADSGGTPGSTATGGSSAAGSGGSQSTGSAGCSCSAGAPAGRAPLGPTALLFGALGLLRRFRRR